MIDILIFIVFLLLNLIIGIKYRGKKQSFKEYAIGNKNFSTATLTATIVATWASGSMFFTGIEQTYSNGLYYLIPSIVGSTFSWLVIGYIIGPRMGTFLNHVSMADAMSSIYGKGVQFVAAVSTILMNIGFIAVQFKVITKILSVLFNYQGPWVTIIAATIIIIYSAFGGIKAVTFTDVIQFITFGTLLPALALVIWQHIPNHGQVVDTLTTNPNFSLEHVISWNPRLMSTLTLLSYFLIPSLAPEIFQRMAMAKDIGQIKRSVAYSAGLLFLIRLFIAWIAILLLTNNPNLSISQVVSYMIEKYTYTGLKGFLGVGVIALAMSSADSALNSCAVLVANDILPPLKITEKASVRIAAISTFVIGLFAILLTLSIQNILQILLFSANFYTPIIVAPMLLTIFGFRTSKRVIFIGIGAGFAITTFLLIYFKDIDSFFPGILANLGFLLGSHYLLKEKGGWIEKKGTYSILTIRQTIINTWQTFKQAITPPNLFAYLETTLPTNEIFYPLTAIYILFSTYLGFYFLRNKLVAQYPQVQYIIFHSVLLIVAMLVIYPIWNEAFRKKRWLIMSVWYLSIFYVFFFLGSLLALFSCLQQELLFIFIGSLIIASFVLPSPVFIGMFLLALPLSWLTFKAITGMPALPTTFNFWQFKVIYIWILLGTLIVTIFNIRSKYIREKAKFKRLYLEKLELELKAKIFNMLQGSPEVYQTEISLAYAGMNVLYDKLGEVLDRLKESLIQFSRLHLNTILNENLITQYWCNTFIKLDRDIQRLSDRLTLSLGKIAPIDLTSQILEKYQENVKVNSEVKLKSLTTFKRIECDAEKISLLISNTLGRAQAHNPAQKPLILRLEDTTIVYKIRHTQIQELREKAIKITITTFGKPIEGKDAYIACPNVGIDDMMMDYISESMLLENISIVDIHYGYMGEEIHTDRDYQQFYVLPIKLSRLIKSRHLLDQWISA